MIPIPVLVEFDHLASKRVGHRATRSFLKATVRGEREISYMSDEVMRRAAEFDSKYADLNLGLVDSCVMAIAERHALPILTFDFRDFRATESAAGPWRLAIDEHLYEREIGR